MIQTAQSLGSARVAAEDRLARDEPKPRTEYEVVTSKGARIKTFDDRSAAVKWLTKPDTQGVVPLSRFPGATVKEVIYPAPVERTVWRERNLRLVSAEGADRAE